MLLKRLYILFLIFISSFNYSWAEIPNDSLLLTGDATDTLVHFIKEDFKQIELQLLKNQKNTLSGNSDSNIFVFHSSTQIVQTLESAYLFWGPRMTHSAVKSAYGVNSSAEEVAINNLLKNVHDKTSRKIVVYITAMATYVDTTYYNLNGTLKEKYKNYSARNLNISNFNVALGKAISIAEQSMYGSINAEKNFTTVVIIRTAQFNLAVTKKGNYTTYTFDTNADVKEKLSFKHQIKVFPAKTISKPCVESIKTSFGREVKSDIKTFVTNLVAQFESTTCNPIVPCDHRATLLKLAIDNKNADEIAKAISEILIPAGQVTTTRTVIKPGDAGVSYDVYEKILRNCLTNEERVKIIKTFLDLNWTSTPYEKIIVDIVLYVPKNEVAIKSFFDELVKQNVVVSLIADIHGDNYDKLINAFVELHQYRKFTTKSSDVIYWGVYSQTGPPQCEEGAYLDTEISETGSIIVRGFYKCTYKITDVNNSQIDDTYDPFSNVCLTFISSPTQLENNKYQVGKIYNVPAIYIRYLDKITWNGILYASAIDAFELAMSPLAIAEIKAARGLWRAYLISLTTLNSINFGLKSTAVRNQIIEVEGGAEFLNIWDKCLLAANVGYFSPFAIKNGKNLLASFKKSRNGIKTKLSPDDYETVENTVIKVEEELKDAGVVIDNSISIVNGAGRHANWVEILDIRNKINVKVGHVIENLDINSAGTKFTGCHSEISLQNHISANPTSRYEFRNLSYDVNSGINDASRVFEAKPVVIKADGSEMIKGNNQGVSSFFPKNWDKNKILDEVEYAIANNHGRDLTSTNPNEYFGFSRDGKVEIHFYYNTDGSIGSYFPKKR